MSGELKPTQLLAVLVNEPVDTQLIDTRLTPEFCIRENGDIATDTTSMSTFR